MLFPYTIFSSNQHVLNYRNLKWYQFIPKKKLFFSFLSRKYLFLQYKNKQKWSWNSHVILAIISVSTEFLYVCSSIIIIKMNVCKSLHKYSPRILFFQIQYFFVKITLALEANYACCFQKFKCYYFFPDFGLLIRLYMNQFLWLFKKKMAIIIGIF